MEKLSKFSNKNIRTIIPTWSMWARTRVQDMVAYVSTAVQCFSKEKKEEGQQYWMFSNIFEFYTAMWRKIYSYRRTHHKSLKFSCLAENYLKQQLLNYGTAEDSNKFGFWCQWWEVWALPRGPINYLAPVLAHSHSF